ncbi:hypothetical protein PHYSODRAFT_560024 [Phytophthora sojae]|uniref:JmjN domain-containing protein n=1 Tax=Phytophthora sojae (strain P6497) TaxID=1094619 RepID=G4ZDC8_PHYSP|nr:hypothetical protein PHYSODRAFT_560024 [Phytophthora sojae]EGZ17363.1 hypothetical protein PHYSODRAFT_560024 [Phytophthora sojae]|eukprot:XP_009526421.1 hypothetical protein PHYSODRAFT_560024 [Phytophthora sojae]
MELPRFAMRPSDPHGASMASYPSPDGSWCPEFHPTRAEFESFATYIRTVVEPQCAKIGICKIIPPRGWFSRSYDISQLQCQVSAPVSQHVAGRKGIFNVDLVERKTMSPAEFQSMAEATTDKEPEDTDDPMEVERRFWKGLRGTMDPPVYGADIVASLFGDADALSWNLNDLNTILRKIDLPGEDMDLYSINYVHTGKPKFWYGVPPDAGFNIAEAVNFASLLWIPYGLKAKVCKCLPDSVRIDMDSFMTKLFEEPQCSPELLGEDPWVFSCKCHKYCSSQNPDAEVEEQWFECSKCKIWAHVRCIHPDLAGKAAEDLPQSLLCHRCIAEAAGVKPRSLSSGGLGKRSGTASKSGVRSCLGKRKKEAAVCSKKKSAKVPVSAVMLSPPKKAKATNQSGVGTPKSATKDRGAVRKYLTVKGSTIRFVDTEAKVAAVEGKYIRVHYKVSSFSWLQSYKCRTAISTIFYRVFFTGRVSRQRRHEMVRPGGKDVSVGEFDPVSGLTHITHQRGRLLFNMGASTKKRQRREAPQPPAVAAKAAPPPPTSTGAFTGLSLYPEEANYLLQRGALAIIYLLSPGDEDARELSVAEFTALLARDPRVSLASMQVYAFLKDQKLHPRRCLEPIAAAEAASSSEDGRSVPRHFVAGEPCDVAFDVWKTVAVDTSAVTATKTKKQKQRKKLVLVFRAVVCRFGDPAPGPRSLRQAIASSNARGCDEASTGADSGCSALLACVQIPVKLAVVHHDQSVLLFEISSSNPAVPN